MHGYPSSGSAAETCGQTDVSRLIGAFRDIANVPKNWMFLKTDYWDYFYARGERVTKYFINTVIRDSDNGTVQ